MSMLLVVIGKPGNNENKYGTFIYCEAFNYSLHGCSDEEKIF